MARKRMFSHDVLESDQYHAMSLQARMLYIYLGMSGDDDGFVLDARHQTRGLGFRMKALDELVDNGYLIRFDSGAMLITHWRLNNSLRNDRYKPTICTKEMNMVELTKNHVYHLRKSQSGDFFDNQMDTQLSITEPNVTQPSETQPNQAKPSETEHNGENDLRRDPSGTRMDESVCENVSDSVSKAVDKPEIPSVETVTEYFRLMGMDQSLSQLFVSYYAAISGNSDDPALKNWKKLAWQWGSRQK